MLKSITLSQVILRLAIIAGISCWSIVAHSGDPEHARRWLDQSDQVGNTLDSSGVYNAYRQVQLGLFQARAWAMLGDIQQTRSRFPDVSASSDWLSGGDGMVRMLMVNLEVDEIRRLLLGSLARSNPPQAVEFALDTYNMDSTNLFTRLGYILEESSAKYDMSHLEPVHQAHIQMGIVSRQLEQGKMRFARRQYKKIDTRFRGRAVEALARRMLLDQDLARLHSLLVNLPAAAEHLQAIAVEVVMLAVRKDMPDLAQDFADQVSSPEIQDRLYGYVALGFSKQDQNERSRKLLAAPGPHKDFIWEQVAITANQHQWLEGFYDAKQDPWRRSERYYQFALRSLTQGDRQGADRMANRALDAAKLIPSMPTRALALRLLTEYQARAGNPAAVLELLAMISALVPEQPDEQNKASANLAVSYALSGKIQSARQTIDSIPEPFARASAAIQVVTIVKPEEYSAYREFIQLAREIAGSLSEPRQRESTWESLITVQLNHKDLKGALESAEAANRQGAGTTAFGTIFEHQLAADEFDAASKTMEQIPTGVDPKTGQDGHQKAMGELAGALASAGHGLRALSVLNQITHKATRELSALPVISALIAEGRWPELDQLLGQLTRSDVKQTVLGEVLAELASKQNLPELTRYLNQVPRRRGAGLCWASTAVTTAAADQIEAWLGSLRHDHCRAFAYAGAAFASLADPKDKQPDSIFAFVDPSKVDQRMERAMRESYSRSRNRQ